MDDQTPASIATEDTVKSEESSFGDILSQFEQAQGRGAREFGQSVEGVVISVTAEAVYLDIGRKNEGVLPAEGSKLKPADHVQVTITGRDTNGYYTLSTVKVVTPVDWSGLEKAYADKSTISGTVAEVVKGGLRIDVGVRAFMPASRSGARDIPEMEKLVGQQIECRITKLDTSNEDVVVDRRVVLEELEAKTKLAAFELLEEGAVVTGTVRNVTDFGAFVDLGGFDGLLHVAEMSYSRGAKPSDLVSNGQQLQVKILKINRQTRKISLGIKQLAPDPWTTACETLKQGDRVQGRVARLTDFGAFVEVAPGVEGLIHVSEMSWSRKQKRPADILKVGETVEVMVLGVNAGERRIALGLKQILSDPWEDAVKKYPVGSVVEAPVSTLANFGAFVELGEGVDGMIHIGDITREKRLEHPKEMLTVGKTVRAQVVEIDTERRRFRLSMKQLEPTNADTFISEHQVGELVTGRVVDAGENRAKVELAEGVNASCKLPRPAEAPAAPASGGSSKTVDLSSMTAMLAAKWKGGGGGGGSTSDSFAASSPDTLRVGQIRQFKIVATDASQKRIEVELAG